MACWSDTETLVNYLRHTFITCDDTGVCEAVLEPPVRLPKPGGIPMEYFATTTESDEDDFDSSPGRPNHSPDIQVDFGHRPRSNTSKQLEQLRQQRIAQNEVKVVSWKPPTDPIPSEEMNQLFKEKIVEKPSKPMESAVSKLIRDSPSAMNENRFYEYARCEATKPGPHAKTFSIFLPMLSDPKARTKPLILSCVGSVKVADLVGLVCYRYTVGNFEPPLSGDVSSYTLFMAEDTGEIEADLPPLNSAEIVARVGFDSLALVQRQNVGGKRPIYVVTVYFPSGDSYSENIETLDVPLSTIKDKVLQRRFEEKNVPEFRRTVMEYNLEKVNEPGVALSLDLTVQNSGATVFVMVRKNSSRGDFSVPGVQSPSVVKEKFAAANETKVRPVIDDSMAVCNFYNVTMVHKGAQFLKANTPVQLAVCTDKVDIVTQSERKQTTVTRFFKPESSSFKSVSYSIAQIGGIEIVDEKEDGGIKTFKLLHSADSSNAEWRSHCFEAESDTVDSIVKSLNGILDTAKNPARLAFSNRVSRKYSIFRRAQSAKEASK